MIAVSLNQKPVKLESAKASSFVEREVSVLDAQAIYKNSTEFYKKHIQNPRIALGTSPPTAPLPTSPL
jgi:glutamate decarboxylase